MQSASHVVAASASRCLAAATPRFTSPRMTQNCRPLQAPRTGHDTATTPGKQTMQMRLQNILLAPPPQPLPSCARLRQCCHTTGGRHCQQTAAPEEFARRRSCTGNLVGYYTPWGFCPVHITTRLSTAVGGRGEVKVGKVRLDSEANPLVKKIQLVPK